MRRLPAIGVYAGPMRRERAERIALTEAAFRIANERMAAWEEVPPDAAELFFCECSSLECRQRVPLTRAAYEAVRARSEWFVIAPGHEVPELEEVVERGGAHWIIEKPPLVSGIVEGTDPRAQQPGPDRAEADGLADQID
jgi:hypothetical protein